MCGLLYSGESVEHFFEMVEDFRQPIGAGKHQPGGVFAAADVREYVGPVFVSLADVPKLEPLPGPAGASHMGDKLADVCNLVRSFRASGGRMRSRNAADLVSTIRAHEECAELPPLSPSAAPAAPASPAPSLEHGPLGPRPEHCHDFQVEGGPHYLLTYMVDIVDEVRDRVRV